jgi:beta-galactosidase beta subunit
MTLKDVWRKLLELGFHRLQDESMYFNKLEYSNITLDRKEEWGKGVRAVVSFEDESESEVYFDKREVTEITLYTAEEDDFGVCYHKEQMVYLDAEEFITFMEKELA